MKKHPTTSTPPGQEPTDDLTKTQCNYCDGAGPCPHLLLVVDTTFRVAEGGLLMDLFNGAWARIWEVRGERRDFKESDTFDALLEEVDALASDSTPELELDGGPGRCSGYRLFYLKSPRRAKAVRQQFIRVARQKFDGIPRARKLASKRMVEAIIAENAAAEQAKTSKPTDLVDDVCRTYGMTPEKAIQMIKDFGGKSPAPRRSWSGPSSVALAPAPRTRITGSFRKGFSVFQNAPVSATVSSIRDPRRSVRVSQGRTSRPR